MLHLYGVHCGIQQPYLKENGFIILTRQIRWVKSSHSYFLWVTYQCVDIQPAARNLKPDESIPHREFDKYQLKIKLLQKILEIEKFSIKQFRD